MFFSQFLNWLTVQLQTYVSVQAVTAGRSLAPAASIFASIYVMGWGYLALTGAIAEPLIDAVRRILILAIVLGVSLHLWLYNDVLVALIVQGPKDLAATFLGAPDPIKIIDTIWEKGGACADTLWNRGGVLSGEVGFYLAGLSVWLIVGTLCLYCAFLLSLSQIATAILLALGPLFVLACLFDRTRMLFDSWISQLINYSLVGLLVAMVAGLLLQLIATFADQTAALGSALSTVDVLDLLLASAIAFLLLKQVLPIAAGLSRGASLSTMGAFSSSIRIASRSTSAIGTAAWNLLPAETSRGVQEITEVSESTALSATRRFIRPFWAQKNN